MGPTASGKTEIAIQLHDDLDVELISVDSSQVYRGMDIGTAKPAPSILKRYPHHLIDIRDIREPYNVASFRRDAISLIHSIAGRGRLPVLVGGTMFYFSALEYGISELPGSDSAVREEAKRELSRKGNRHLHDFLTSVDPHLSGYVRASDTQRLLRAVELYRVSGRPPSRLFRQFPPKKLDINLVKIALFCSDRSILHQRIAGRFREMLETGLIGEVERLVQGVSRPESLPAMRSVGYRQVLEYLQHGGRHRELQERGIVATRRLAKRQLTWLRNQANVIWLDTLHPGCADGLRIFLREHPLVIRFHDHRHSGRTAVCS